jgi:hypothetical protein
MKRYGLVISLLLVSSVSFAQHKKDEKLVSLKLGFSTTGLLLNALGKVDLTSQDSFTIGNISTSSRPALSATFDYSLTDRLSLGGIFSHQVFSGTITDYAGVVRGKTIGIDQIDFKLKRTYLGVIPKIHWAINNEDLDIYSGIRLGFLLWTSDVNVNEQNFKALDAFKGGRLALGLVPIGATIYLNQDLGLNADISIGAPYVFSIGVNYRF